MAQEPYPHFMGAYSRPARGRRPEGSASITASATTITGSSVHACPVGYADIQLQRMRVAPDVSGCSPIPKIVRLHKADYSL